MLNYAIILSINCQILVGSSLFTKYNTVNRVGLDGPENDINVVKLLYNEAQEKQS